MQGAQEDNQINRIVEEVRRVGQQQQEPVFRNQNIQRRYDTLLTDANYEVQANRAHLRRTSVRDAIEHWSSLQLFAVETATLELLSIQNLSVIERFTLTQILRRIHITMAIRNERDNV